MTSSTKRIILWVIAAVAIVGVLILLWLVGKSFSDIKPYAQGDWIQGSENAPVILTEYGDFQCPSCGAIYPVIQQAQKDFGDKLAVVFREFPLSEIHPNALAAAYAAEAAGKRGKFWEMHDLLFERQKFWENEQNPDSKFADYADTLGLNKDQFAKDYQSDEIHKKVENDRAMGNKAGINATPTLFLNGKAISSLPQSYAELKQKITDALPQTDQ
jgi:protein-disulfide isomerase